MVPLQLYLIMPGLFVFAAAQSPSQSIEIEACVSQLRNAKGNLVFFLWRPTDPGFPDGDKGRPFRKAMVPAEFGKVVFSDVPTGTYAISVFHDEKGTGTMDRNLLGFPRSGVGMSGGFAPPPTFQKSRFLATTSQRVALEVHYLK